MEKLNKREKELVALGASMASNCIPCVVFHIGEAMKNGVTREQISEAVEVADKVRKVPANNVLNAAYGQIDESAWVPAEKPDSIPPDCCT